MALHPVGYLATVFPGLSRSGCYRIAQTYPELTVRVGRKVYVSADAVEAFVARGGKPLGDLDANRSGDRRTSTRGSAEPRPAA